MQPLSSFLPLIGRYDAFLLDLWGVIHDGRELYPGVVETLTRMREAGKRVIFLSNAPRRAFRAVEGLKRLGVPGDLYDHVYSSGEAVFEYLSSEFSVRGSEIPYAYIGPERDADLLAEGPFLRTEDYAEAKFVLNTGFDDDFQALADKEAEVRKALKHQLPMICANPDRVIVRRDGTRALCAGIINEEYDRRGGESLYFGKPFPQVYAYCFSRLGAIPKPRILAVGDNLHTDIAGGNAAGIDTALIAGGILSAELGYDFGQMPPDTAALEARFVEEKARPTWLAPAFGA